MLCQQSVSAPLAGKTADPINPGAQWRLVGGGEGTWVTLGRLNSRELAQGAALITGHGSEEMKVFGFQETRKGL